tara:strand:- start:60431 stop:61072 length:642 start_codon:yes stop_codon:yes gene_type:complete
MESDLEIIKHGCYKGTRILMGNHKAHYLEFARHFLRQRGFDEIHVPIIQPTSIFQDKVGKENNNLMYTFKDRGERDLCLAPEYTAVIQGLSQTHFKNHEDVLLFYIQECFRGEKPQAGRYRQFTQLGVEILNPSIDHTEMVVTMAEDLLYLWKGNKVLFTTTRGVGRGLDYYTEGKGFEIQCGSLGSSKQVVGGGEYEGGIGFAIGVDRLILT